LTKGQHLTFNIVRHFTKNNFPAIFPNPWVAEWDENVCIIQITGVISTNMNVSF